MNIYSEAKTMLDIIIGTAADIAEIFVDFWVEKVVRRFSKKKKDA